MKVIPLRIFLFIAILSLIISCRKEGKARLSDYTIQLESSRADGGTAVNKCFVDLDIGQAYAFDDAKVNQNKVDLMYTYMVPVGGYLRILQPMHTPAFPEFSNLSLSTITPADTSGMTDADFDDLENSGDVERLFKKFNFQFWQGAYVDITRSADDLPQQRIFAFVTGDTKKKGFLKVVTYQPRLGTFDKATITIQVKIQS